MEVETSTKKQNKKVRGPYQKKTKYLTYNRNKMREVIAEATRLIQQRQDAIEKKNKTKAVYSLGAHCAAEISLNSSNGEQLVKSLNFQTTLLELRKCLLHHNWAAAKRLLLLFLNDSSCRHHQARWNACVTVLAHCPGAEHLLKDLMETQGLHRPDILLEGILTINGLSRFRLEPTYSDDGTSCDGEDDESDSFESPDEEQ